MANAVLYRLHFRSPLHVGERGVGLEETRTHVPADTLFSAICSAWRWLYGAETLQSDLLAPFLHGEQPPFLLSSAFPFAGEVLFFPKPLSPLKMEPQQHTDYNHKRLKSIRYVSRERFAQWVQGQAIPYASFPEEEEPVFWLSKEERGVLSSFVDDETGHLRLWSVTVVPRVTLDRQTSASQIWFFGQVAFYQGAGLWCAVRYNDASLRPRVEACLRLLGDNGLGGERGSGFGLFELSASDREPLPEADGAEYMVTLSPCCPHARQMQSLIDRRCAYELIPRRGWVGSPEGGSLRRKSVWMLAEGSVLRRAGDIVPGCLANVKPDPCPHEVWRYGYAFPLGVNL